MQSLGSQHPRFQVVVADAGPGRIRLRVVGDVDLATADTLADALLRAVQGATGPVEVDLSDVGFLDARGVAVLVRAGAAAGTHGGVLRLLSPRPPVRRVLELTRVAAVCEVRTD